MTRTALILGMLFTTAGLALSLAPDSSATTAAGTVHSAAALPAGRGGGGSGGGGGGGAGGSSGGSGGGHGDGGQQYNATIASVDKDARQDRRRPIRKPRGERVWDGCGGGYYEGTYGCYQPQA